jgi:hypothetical protein
LASPSITLLGSVFNTTSGTKSVAGLTPAVDSLIVIVAAFIALIHITLIKQKIS